MINKFKILGFLYLILYILYAIYSYAFLDIALTLTSFKPYLEFQKRMLSFGYFNRQTSTIIFLLLSFLLFTIYYLVFNSIKKEKISLKKILLLTLMIAGILIFSYPAFSHDIFNYIFNAKMLLIYHANPHQHSAWEFNDSMLGFMRNVHTPAPYFYGWTLLSLIPFMLGLNRIFTEILSFKLFSAILFIGTFWVLKKLLKKINLSRINERLYLFLLNPFILIEAVSVSHNDFSMVLPALLSFYFLIQYKERKILKFILLTFFTFLFSVSTKYATVVLLPLFFIWYLKSDLDIGLLGAIGLFLVPFTRPLDQLHSWYLIWPLTWIFLAKKMESIYFFCFLSFFAFLRYAPYVYYGNWDPPVPFLRLLIYFLIPGFILLFLLRNKLFKRKSLFNKTN